MLRLLVDTSTWLDLAKRRDGQTWIVALRALVHWNKVELLVPAVILDEFNRNEAKVKASMTANVADRLRQIRSDFEMYGGDGQVEAAALPDGLVHQVPLIGAMTTRNFDEIRELLDRGRRLEPTDADRARTIQRALAKVAPFHRQKNSVADALLIEVYSSTVAAADSTEDTSAFITSNSSDFSQPNGDQRLPHPDLAQLFDREGSAYVLGVEGLDALLVDTFGQEYEELREESDFREEPRRLDEIQQAEQELFDRIWYQRCLNREWRIEQDRGPEAAKAETLISQPGMRKVQERYGGPENLGPYNDFEWGMLNGKLSALRWVLGSDWDFLDT